MRINKIELQEKDMKRRRRQRSVNLLRRAEREERLSRERVKRVKVEGIRVEVIRVGERRGDERAKAKLEEIWNNIFVEVNRRNFYLTD